MIRRGMILLIVSQLGQSYRAYDPSVYYQPIPSFDAYNEEPVDLKDYLKAFGVEAERVQADLDDDPGTNQIRPNEDWKLVTANIIRPEELLEGSGMDTEGSGTSDGESDPPRNIKLIQPIVLEKGMPGSFSNVGEFQGSLGSMGQYNFGTQSKLDLQGLLDRGKVVVLNFCPDAIKSMDQNQLAFLNMVQDRTTPATTPGTLMMYHAVKVVSHTTPSTAVIPTQPFRLGDPRQFPMDRRFSGYEDPNDDPSGGNFLEKLISGKRK